MKIINKSRGSGKTTQLIYLSEATGYPIISRNPKFVSEQARSMGCKIPKPISFDKALNGFPIKYSVLIDDSELFLDAILYKQGINAEVITMTIPMNEYPSWKLDNTIVNDPKIMEGCGFDEGSNPQE